MTALTIFLVAGEESGDRLGAALMRALRQRHGQEIEFRGTGGRDMAAEGLQTLFPIDELSIIGITGLPHRLPAILRRIRETAAAVVAARPDVLVIIDSPDFTHRVARRVRAASPGIPIVNYVSPSVWAWRPWRARSMRRYIDHVLALLPFEPAAHAKLGGPPCTYVGHPLADAIRDLRPSEAETGRRMTEPPVLLVLPGSRVAELTRLLATFAETVEGVSARAGPLEVILPTVPHLVGKVEKLTADWAIRPRIVVDPAEKRSAFRVARAALTKSGTVTLELALSGIPMVAAYKVSAFEYSVARLVVRVPSVILANLVLGENAIPEFLQHDCTPGNLRDALVPLLADTPARRRQVEAFARLDTIMEIGRTSPADRAAHIVLACVDLERAQELAAASESGH